MVNKLIIAAGTAHYDHLPPQLQRPDLTQVVDSVATLFTNTLGYSRVLEEIGSDPTSDDLVKKLDKWFASTDRSKSDKVVFYYTGHGELEGDNLFLLTRDSQDGLIASTAISAERIGQILASGGAGGEKRRVKNCLLILDTCHSGAGAFDVMGKLRKLFDESEHGLFCVLAAALPREEAMAGALARALIASIQDESLGGAQQSVLSFERVGAAINRRLRPHRAVYAILGSSDEEAQFFSNPRYVPGLPSSVTAAETRRAAQSQDLQGFWGPTSRGVELELQPGSFFTGRKRALTDLSQWLRDPADRRTMVVTGSPCSGKSAILSKIVTLSDPEYRMSASAQQDKWLKAFPEGGIDLALHAKGKSIQDLTGRFAACLGSGTSLDEVLNTLKKRKAPFNVVVDALDEASEPDQIVSDLLEPLHAIPAVKLLVGTRLEYASKLGEGSFQLRVDQPDYFEKADLKEYVATRLLMDHAEGKRSRFRKNSQLVAKLAESVADNAYPNFLIARLVTDEILSTPQTANYLPELLYAALKVMMVFPFIDLDILGTGVIGLGITVSRAIGKWYLRSRTDFPATVGRAFERFLSRFGSDEQKARDLLKPLAWTEGAGLPWDVVWPALASALSGRSYGDDDIRWALNNAGAFIIETLEEGRSVHRLYHQAVTDYLRQESDAESQSTIVGTLIETVPLFEEGRPGYDWRQAHPYVRVHLAEHAAACGKLGDLLKDPLFLLTADPDRLLAVLDAQGADDLQDITRLYKLGIHHLRAKPIEEAASYLEMTARQNGVEQLANKTSELPLSRAWKASWAHWLPSGTHRQIPTGSAVLSLALVRAHESLQIVVGGQDGHVRTWDFLRGSFLGEAFAGGSFLVNRIAVCQLQGSPLVVAGCTDGTVHLWNLIESKSMEPIFRFSQPSPVTAVAAGEVGGHFLVVAGTENGTLNVWDLSKRTLLHEFICQDEGSVNAIKVAEQEGQGLLIAIVGGTLHVWDVFQATPLKAPRVIGGWGNALGQVDGRVVCESHSDFLTMQLVDILDETLVGRPFQSRSGVYAAAIGEVSGRPIVVVSTMPDETMYVWDAENGLVFGSPLLGHQRQHMELHPVRALAVEEEHGKPIIVSGGADGTVRIWDIDPAGLETTPGTVWNMVLPARVLRFTLEGSQAIVTDQGQVFDMASGAFINQLFPSRILWHRGAAASAEVNGRPVLAAVGNTPHSLQVWDLNNSTVIAERPDEAYPVTAVAIVEVDENAVICYGDGAVKGGGVIRLWEFQKGNAVKEFFPTHPWSAGDMVTGSVGGNPVVVSYALDGTIYRWNVSQGTLLGAAIQANQGFLYAASIGDLNGRAVIISGGQTGSIRFWDLAEGTPIGEPFQASESAITAIATGSLYSQPVIVSGSQNGTLCIWKLQEPPSLLISIEVDAPIVSIAMSETTTGDQTLAIATTKGLMGIKLSF